MERVLNPPLCATPRDHAGLDKLMKNSEIKSAEAVVRAMA